MASGVKLSMPKPLMSGMICTSHKALFSFRLALVLVMSSLANTWGNDFKSLAVTFFVEVTSTPMMMSAPISLSTSAGKLFTKPPSTSTLSPMVTGENTPGMAILARMAVGMLPLRSTTSWPEIMSVATQAKGMGKSLKSMSSW